MTQELASPPPIQSKRRRSIAAELKAATPRNAPSSARSSRRSSSVFQKEKGSYRELIINSEPLEKRVALLVDGRLEKFEIERESDNRMVGGIFKGRIKNLDPGLKAAFVDIGYSKNAFLHYWDMLPAAADSSVEVVRVNRKKTTPSPRARSPSRTSPASIRPAPTSSSRSPRARSAPRARAPRPTSPCPAATSSSRPTATAAASPARSRTTNERRRLKQLINELTIPEGMGVIVRTAGEGKKARYFVRDLHILLKKWEEIQRKMQTEQRPGLPLHGARPRRAHRARLPHRGHRPRAHRQQGRLRAHARTSSA